MTLEQLTLPGMSADPPKAVHAEDDPEIRELREALLRVVTKIVSYLERHPEKTADAATRAVVDTVTYRRYGSAFRDAAVRRLQKRLAQVEESNERRRRGREVADRASSAIATPGD